MSNNKTDGSLRINGEIRVKQVRLITDEGDQIGVVSIQEAQEMAEKRDLDLVEVAPKANPPVCKIMNYGKYIYRQQKREKKNKKKQSSSPLKEMRFRPRIDEHDIMTKVNKIIEFLENGSKVKLTVMFRGREMAHKDLGVETLDNVLDKLSDVADIDNEPTMIGRFLSVYVVPKKKGD
ncbi:MAG: translation initiation factor IF-3 [Candidatus Marinimicrobia bacterium]|nr:translation initiation factor IF-3 [Candidatus Neomarinimicrobiota bacterium]